ncbi:hypothetical protein [Laedolimicola ammoniilytica]|uniref:Uncharacterized protein n=1 Tax=Laedolimicola ammoniilytica TaxID=2981771 RepID=A0ABT2RZR3_9FIRM|nr:hypothetical protein [Laedolimicola ammoniilytica]MCU6697829.1 hypothetical protein [Laedolimicola ammoniilytica]SCI48696.1 Uncharacterised protein [uncultured Clostridium sp.]
MKDTLKKIFKNFAVLLLVSAVLGIIVGIIFGEKAAVLSPFGTVFTRLLGMYAVGTAPNVGQLILFALMGVAFSIAAQAFRAADLLSLSSWSTHSDFR